MVRCSFIKGNGERCKGSATAPHGLCWSHAPENAERRSWMASKAARSKPNGELTEIRQLLKHLTARVLGVGGGKPMETGRAAVANQLTNSRLRLVELERKIRETEELEERIEALERTRTVREGDERWRA